jgi:hypothetical protein
MNIEGVAEVTPSVLCEINSGFTQGVYPTGLAMTSGIE